MALIIKGEMPTCCDRCFSNFRCPAYARQVHKIWKSEHEQVFDVFGEMRLDDCPIIGEIPDTHGRLADVDAIIRQLRKWGDAPIKRNNFEIANLLESLVETNTVLEASNGHTD